MSYHYFWGASGRERFARTRWMRRMWDEAGCNNSDESLITPAAVATRRRTGDSSKLEEDSLARVPRSIQPSLIAQEPPTRLRGNKRSSRKTPRIELRNGAQYYETCETFYSCRLFGWIPFAVFLL